MEYVTKYCSTNQLTRTLNSYSSKINHLNLNCMNRNTPNNKPQNMKLKMLVIILKSKELKK